MLRFMPPLCSLCSAFIVLLLRRSALFGAFLPPLSAIPPRLLRFYTPIYSAFSALIPLLLRHHLKILRHRLSLFYRSALLGASLPLLSATPALYCAILHLSPLLALLQRFSPLFVFLPFSMRFRRFQLFSLCFAWFSIQQPQHLAPPFWAPAATSVFCACLLDNLLAMHNMLR